MRSLKLLAVVLLTCVAAVAQTDTTPAKPPVSFDKSAFDTSVKPCDDFYQFACGGWRKANPIPGDKARWGRFDQLAEFNQYTLRDILEQASKPTPGRTPVERQVGDLYASCMDQSAIDRRGLEPIRADLAAIAGASTKSDLARVLGTLRSSGVGGPFTFG